jgi:hypothetical protein
MVEGMSTIQSKAFVYVLGESEVQPEDIAISSDYFKVGILTESDHTDPYYQRRRALQQGNIRVLEFYFTHKVETEFDWQKASESAREIESIAHSLLRIRGYTSRKSETDLTGHGEWYKVPKDVAIQIVKEAVSEWETRYKKMTYSELEDLIKRLDDLGITEHRHILTDSMDDIMKAKPREAVRIQSDLFKW